MIEVWFDNLSFSNMISESQARERGGVLVFLDERGEKSRYETYFMHQAAVQYGYFTLWPAEAMIADHMLHHPESGLSIRTPPVNIDGYSTFRIYDCTKDGILSGVKETAENEDDGLLFERFYDASNTLTWTVQHIYDREGELIYVLEIAPDGQIANTDEIWQESSNFI